MEHSNYLSSILDDLWYSMVELEDLLDEGEEWRLGSRRESLRRARGYVQEYHEYMDKWASTALGDLGLEEEEEEEDE